MGEPSVLPVLDDPPKSGGFAVELAELELTAEEIAEGNALGLWASPDRGE